ncbi:hypothetical protein GGX14DRAFT_568136 [Mycena pura]|uniref:DUF6532 domain-containing protein n=1 Tax=Mycena pura TaxID=153505 RepID=A0AAD6VDC2_9AGAR|nr:hypothetical protein GGX14DRAFT_568136 [Mycena pura]
MAPKGFKPQPKPLYQQIPQPIAASEDTDSSRPKRKAKTDATCGSVLLQKDPTCSPPRASERQGASGDEDANQPPPARRRRLITRDPVVVLSEAEDDEPVAKQPKKSTLRAMLQQPEDGFVDDEFVDEGDQPGEDDDGEDYQEPVDDLAELDEDAVRDRLADAHDDSDAEDDHLLTHTRSSSHASRSSSRASNVSMSSGHVSVPASEDDDEDDPAVAALATAHRRALQPRNSEAKDRGELSGSRIDLSKISPPQPRGRHTARTEKRRMMEVPSWTSPSRGRSSSVAPLASSHVRPARAPSSRAPSSQGPSASASRAQSASSSRAPSTSVSRSYVSRTPADLRREAAQLQREYATPGRSSSSAPRSSRLSWHDDDVETQSFDDTDDISLVPNARGTINLRAQRPKPQKTLGLGLDYFLAHLIHESFYPDVPDRARFILNALTTAANDLNYADVAAEIARDTPNGRILSEYGEGLGSVLHGRTSTTRRPAKHAAETNMFSSYGVQNESHALIGRLQKGQAFIYPHKASTIDPTSQTVNPGRPETNKPYLHPGVTAVVADTFFNGPTTFVPNAHGNLEATAPMVAISCAAIYDTFEDWKTGVHKPTDFEGKRVQDAYELHHILLAQFKVDRPDIYRVTMETIFQKASAGSSFSKHGASKKPTLLQQEALLLFNDAA